MTAHQLAWICFTAMIGMIVMCTIALAFNPKHMPEPLKTLAWIICCAWLGWVSWLQGNAILTAMSP